MTDPKVIRLDDPTGVVIEGDLLEEQGPRIGRRLWRVVALDRKRRWTHAQCVPGRPELGDTPPIRLIRVAR